MMVSSIILYSVEFEMEGGTFSNSKFTSYMVGHIIGFKYLHLITHWENGVFLSGQFGQPSYATNSMVYGQF